MLTQDSGRKRIAICLLSDPGNLEYLIDFRDHFQKDRTPFNQTWYKSFFEDVESSQSCFYLFKREIFLKCTYNFYRILFFCFEFPFNRGSFMPSLVEVVVVYLEKMKSNGRLLVSMRPKDTLMTDYKILFLLFLSHITTQQEI